jgi:C4-dicarboxylate transporter DctM subunit
MSPLEIADKTIPTLLLIVAVLGGIYTGWLTPVEAGAAGSLLGSVDCCVP